MCCSVLQCDSPIIYIECIAVYCIMLQRATFTCVGITIVRCLSSLNICEKLNEIGNMNVTPGYASQYLCVAVLQYVAVCCSVLQGVAAGCSALQCVAVCCIMLQSVAVRFIVLK